MYVFFRLSSKNKSSKTDEDYNPTETPNHMRDQTPSQMTVKSLPKDEVVAKPAEVVKVEVVSVNSLLNSL
jgi:hypothetical protein